MIQFQVFQCLVHWPEAVARITVDNWLQKIQIASPSRLIYLLFPWTSFSAAWCPLGVSPVDLPASMYLRPRYQEPTQNFRVFVETLVCPEFSGFFGCPQLPTMALLYLFWNPKLNCHFLGRNKACNPNRHVFTHFCSAEYGKKQTPCFFWVPFSSFFGQPTIWNRCPKKTGPTVSFYPRNWKCMGSVLSSGPRDRVLVCFQLRIFSPQLLHTYVQTAAYVYSKHIHCQFFAKKNDIFTYR